MYFLDTINNGPSYNAYGQIVFKLLGNPPNDVNTQPRQIKTSRLFQYITASQCLFLVSIHFESLAVLAPVKLWRTKKNRDPAG
jgi:hypothetical protein